jgi:hypothetical protein
MGQKQKRGCNLRDALEEEVSRLGKRRKRGILK